MSIVEAIVAKVNALSPEKREQVLDFAEFLQDKAAREKKTPWPSLRGALEQSGFDISEEAIDEARREMWGEWMEPRP